MLLALPVVSSVGGGLSAWSTAYLVGFAVLLVLLAGVQGRPWAIWVNLGVQLILIAGFLVYPAVGFVGALRRGVAADRLPARRGPAPAAPRPAARPATAARLTGTLCAVTAPVTMHREAMRRNGAR